MPLVLADRVNETTTTTSTGTITLAGAVSGYQSFAVIGNGNTTYYTIVHQTANEWEVGIGTYTSSGTTLSRDTVLASSNSGSLVNFSAGTKFVFCDYPAGRAVYLDTATNVTIPGLTLSGGTANGVLYLNGSKVATSGSALTFDGTNLGVGTASPVARLDVLKTSSDTISRTNAIGAFGDYVSLGAGLLLQQTLSSPYGFALQAANAANSVQFPLLLNPSGGNVGIGTASPAVKLEVSGSVTTTADVSGLLTLGRFSAGYPWSLIRPSSGSSGFEFRSFAGTAWLNIDTSGNLGIGTASPSEALEISRTTDPKIRFVDVGNLDAKVGIVGSTALGFEVNGSERMRLDSAGRFLLGASSNTSRGGSNTTALFYKASGTQYLDIQTGTSGDSGIVFSATSSSAYGLINYSNSVNAMLFYANSAEVFRITSSGLLGLGTTSPAAKLHVVNSTPNSGKQTLFLDSNYGNAGDSVASIRATVNNNAGGTYIWGLTSESVLAHNMEFISGSNYVARSTTASYLSQAGGVFSFYSNQSLTAGNTFTPTERMRLDTSGNLGIGISVPSYRLDLQGASGVGMQIYETSTGNNNRLIITQTGTISRFTSTYSNGSGIFAWNIGGSEYMRLDSSGNLGIGTTSPGVKLDVSGAGAGGLSLFRIVNTDTTASSPALMLWSTADDGTQRNRAGIGSGADGANNGYLYFNTRLSGSLGEKMRLNSSGNLGLGVTPSAWASSYKSFQLGSTASLVGATNFTFLNTNVYFDSSDTPRYLTTAAATRYQQDGGAHKWFYAGSGTAGNAISFTQAMTLTASGSLGIGTASPAYRLQVQKTATATPAFMIGGGFFGGPRLQVYGLDDNGAAWMGMGTDMSAGIYELSIYYPNASGNGRISFGTYNGTTYTERMSLSQAGNLNVVGALSKGSGSFRIPHPLKEETHDLVHSFIEGPQADLIYSGKVQLEDGVATVNIDAASGMTEGTFVVLCRDIRCFTNNETDWDNVRGKVIGNLLTIECQNPDSDAVISWMVIGERQDKHMYDTDWTDADGKVIVEPLKPVIKKSYN